MPQKRSSRKKKLEPCTVQSSKKLDSFVTLYFFKKDYKGFLMYFN